ncbi:MAG: Holliday junction resolvase RuvX [Candidatus Berkiellales bacterium]
MQVEEGIYLSFDFGTKYIGIAVGQSITHTANPVTTLPAKNGIPSWDQLGDVIKKWQPKGLIVGLALQPDSSASDTSLAAQKFGHHLNKHFNLPIYFIEERLTTVAAKQRLKEQYPTTHYQHDVDAMSAVIILESWFNSDKKEIAIGVSNSPSI